MQKQLFLPLPTQEEIELYADYERGAEFDVKVEEVADEYGVHVGVLLDQFSLLTGELITTRKKPLRA